MKKQLARFPKAYGQTKDDRIKLWQTVKALKEKLFKSQHGKCALCQIKLESVNKADLDHDHDTGKVRELLCKSCNRWMETKAAKDRLFMLKVRHYIQKHKEI